MSVGDGSMEDGARARARKAVRTEVAAIVAGLMLERGYEHTTVDDICTAAQISRSTFFRYFPSKEDALFGGVADTGELLLAALVARPEGEMPWTAMRRALDPLVELNDANDERFRDMTRLVVNTPALAARHREKNARWHELLRPEVARRLGADPTDVSDPRANALIAAALGCVEATLSAWTASAERRPLSAILDEAMGAVR